MDDSSVPPVDGDSGLAGSIVAEQLQTLRVACEGSSDARAAGPPEDGEQVPLPPERLWAEAPANSSELPREPEPPWVALKGGGVAGDAPYSSAAAEEKPAAVEEDSNGRTSPGTGGEQACPPVEHPQAMEAPSDKEGERQPSEEAKVVDPHQPPSSSDFQGGNSEQNGDLDRQTAALGLIEKEALSKEKPAAQRSEKKGSLSGEGGARSESDR